jgi:hypothetical protein
LLTDQEEISNLYRGPSYQVPVHLAKQFRKEDFFPDPLANMAATGLFVSD